MSKFIKESKTNKQTNMAVNKNNFKSPNWVESLDAGCPQYVINCRSQNIYNQSASVFNIVFTIYDYSHADV